MHSQNPHDSLKTADDLVPKKLGLGWQLRSMAYSLGIVLLAFSSVISHWDRPRTERQPDAGPKSAAADRNAQEEVTNSQNGQFLAQQPFGRPRRVPESEVVFPDHP